MQAVIATINTIMLIAGMAVTLATLWLGTRIMKLNSASEAEYQAQLRRTISRLAIWVGIGLIPLTGYTLVTFPGPTTSWFWWTFLLSVTGAYVLLLMGCACFYAVAKRQLPAATHGELC